MDFGVKVQVERKRSIARELVDLGHDVEVRKVHLEHGSQRKQERRDIQRRLCETI